MEFHNRLNHPRFAIIANLRLKIGRKEDRMCWSQNPILMSFWLRLNENIEKIVRSEHTKKRIQRQHPIWCSVLHMPVCRPASNSICIRTCMVFATSPMCVNLNGIVRLYRSKVLFQRNNVGWMSSPSSLYGHVTAITIYKWPKIGKNEISHLLCGIRKRLLLPNGKWKCVPRVCDIDQWTHMLAPLLHWNYSWYLLLDDDHAQHQTMEPMLSHFNVHRPIQCWADNANKNNYFIPTNCFRWPHLGDGSRSAKTLRVATIKMCHKFPFIAMVRSELRNIK